MAAAVAAKAQGMVGAIGITGHGHDAPRVHREALRRFPFETVLTPLNFVLEARAPYRQAYAELVTAARQQEGGLMTIKAIARGGEWPADSSPAYHTWYTPFDQAADIQRAVAYVLSHPEITGFATAGDVHLLPLILDAAEHYQAQDEVAMQAMRNAATAYASPFEAMT